MADFRFPTVFLGHGTPMLAFGDDAYQRALHSFSAALPKPKAVVVLSAHSVSSNRIHVLRCVNNRIQYDFSGFPPELYEIRYPCPGSPAVADQVARLLEGAGFEVDLDTDAPLDHGIWIPLLHLYPEGTVPVVRVSLPLNLVPAQILKMGRSLARLREEGVLLVASGGAVHNLRELKWSSKNTQGADWANRFEEWLVQSLQAKNVEALMNFEEHPDFARAHPSTEHFLPLLFTVGSALPGDSFEQLFRGVQYETLSMLCFVLSAPSARTIH